MSKQMSRDELGILEDLYLPKDLLSLNLFGRQFRISYQRQRWTSSGRNRIALIVVHHESAWARRVAKGVASSLASALGPHDQPIIDILSADASADYLAGQTFPHLEKHRAQYAAIVTVGDWVSTKVRGYLKAHSWQTTQVFLGVHDPVASGLVSSLDRAHKHMVGVTGSVLDYARYIKLLKMVRPKAKTVLVPYDPSFIYAGFSEEKQRLAYHLERSGMQLRTLTVDLHENVADQLRPHLANTDVVWSLHEEATQIHAKRIAKLCGENKVTFCASDLACVFQGAALGFGDSGTLLGAYGGQLCFALCVGKDAGHVLHSLEVPHPSAMRVNPNFVEAQGLELDGTARAFIQDVVPLGWE